MSTQAIPVPAAPARTASTALAHIGHAIWRAVERMGHLRAASELQRLAACYEYSNPELAAQLRKASRYQPV